MKNRIFIGVREVAGYYSQLHQGFKEIGVSSSFFISKAHIFKYDIDSIKFPLSKYLIMFSEKSHDSNNFKMKLLNWILWFLLWQFLRWPIFFWAAITHDVFILRAVFTLLPFGLELPILRLLNRKVILVFHGTESRPPFMNGKFYTGGNKLLLLIPLVCLFQKIIIRFSELFVFASVNHPPTVQYHRKLVFQYLCIGVPYNRPEKLPIDTSSNRSPVRILHCPSNPVTKGSYYIHSSIENLLHEGFDIELVEIVGQPHHVVEAELAKCDFVIDQVFSDTPMSGFPTEAAFFKKPAIISGYYVENISSDIPAKAIPPSVYVHPANLEKAIRDFLLNKEQIIKKGQEAFDFVCKNWRRDIVAQRFIKIINEQYPSTWLYDPKNCSYILGYGLSQGKLRNNLKKVLKYFPISSLLVSDKPLLNDTIRQFLHKSDEL